MQKLIRSIAPRARLCGASRGPDRRPARGAAGIRRAGQVGGAAPGRSGAVALITVALIAGAAAPGAGDELAPAAAAVADGDLQLALGRMAELFEAGYPTPSQVLADPRFSPLREDPEARAGWRDLMRAHARESRVTMVVPDEPGEAMLVRGHVVRSPDGVPIAGAVLEISHTDATGRYEPGEGAGKDRRARLFAFVRSDHEGRFELRTVKPAPYPGSSEGAAHVHFRIHADGYRSYGADFRPYDHPRDPEERATSIARGWRFSTVHHEDELLVCELTIPMQPRAD